MDEHRHGPVEVRHPSVFFAECQQRGDVSHPFGEEWKLRLGIGSGPLSGGTRRWAQSPAPEFGIPQNSSGRPRRLPQSLPAARLILNSHAFFNPTELPLHAGLPPYALGFSDGEQGTNVSRSKLDPTDQESYHVLESSAHDRDRSSPLRPVALGIGPNLTIARYNARIGLPRKQPARATAAASCFASCRRNSTKYCAATPPPNSMVSATR